VELVPLQRNELLFVEDVTLLKEFKTSVKDRVHCFSIQVVMNKCFFQNPEKNFGANPSCRFREKRSFNSEK